VSGRSAAVLVLFAIGAAACGKTLTATEIMVVVDAEPGVRAQTEKLHVVVSGGADNASERRASDRTLSLAARDLAWPSLTALVPSKDDSGRVYEFVATALDAHTNTVAQVRAISGYVAHERLALRLLLEDGCVGKTCGSGLTCRKAECTSANVDQGKLSPFTQANLKPTTSDGGADAGHADGGDASLAVPSCSIEDRAACTCSNGKVGVKTCELPPAKGAFGACDCMAAGDGGVFGAGRTDGGAVDAGGASADAGPAPVVFPFAPSNVDLSVIDFLTAPLSTIDCGDVMIDTSGSVSVTGWCGDAPSLVVKSQANGPEIVVLPLRSFTLKAGRTIRVVGTRPVVFAVAGDTRIDGLIDANAQDSIPGPGGSLGCTVGIGHVGLVQSPTAPNGFYSGGSGGGFGTAGGSSYSSKGGQPEGTTTLTPLRGGCSGGSGVICSKTGGAGGGAVQISASGLLTGTGTISTRGGNGAPFQSSCSSGYNSGLTSGSASGGGSGGGILLQADTLDESALTLIASGGTGGGLGGLGATDSTTIPDHGSSSTAGGGGGYGRLVINGKPR
jgi:hypothetical protein